MQGAKPCFPIPPCQDLSAFRPYVEHPAVGLWRGWHTAAAGLECDPSETAAFKQGHAWWLEYQIEVSVAALRTAADEMRLPVAKAPRVWL